MQTITSLLQEFCEVSDMRNYNVAVVGATGLVGSTFLKVLKEYNFPIKNLTFKMK